jgi:hypothetical protein
MDDVHNLIRDYSAAVRESFADLLGTYPSYGMVPRDSRIPRRGTLPSGRIYSFHGIGCRFEKDGIVADMDFGSDGRTDGFDAWRLHIFAESIGDEIVTIEEIQSALDALQIAGEITKGGPESFSSLYFPANPTST